MHAGKARIIAGWLKWIEVVYLWIGVGGFFLGSVYGCIHKWERTG